MFDFDQVWTMPYNPCAWKHTFCAKAFLNAKSQHQGIIEMSVCHVVQPPAQSKAN